MIKFSPSNAKTKHLYGVEALQKYLLNRKVYSFDLLSGYSCPFANTCLSKVRIIEGRRKISDGPNTIHRCFSASQEALHKYVYERRKNNFESLKHLSFEEMLDIIKIPSDLGICRIHVGGDFFNQTYFDVWNQIAYDNPDRLFYAYTKSLPFWLHAKKTVGISKNFILTASYGGRYDKLISKHKLRYAKITLSRDSELPIDIDDSHAANPETKNQSFALLIHGTQPKHSLAAKIVHQLKRESYV